MLSRTQALCVSADLFSACFCYGTSEGTFDLMQGVARYAVAAQRKVSGCGGAILRGCSAAS